VGGWRYVRENSLSKYYNHIDFELAFDESERPVDMFANPPLEAARFGSFLSFNKFVKFFSSSFYL
jgi:hypothetical protein